VLKAVPSPLKPLGSKVALLDLNAFAEGVAGVTPNLMFFTELAGHTCLTSFGPP